MIRTLSLTAAAIGTLALLATPASAAGNAANGKTAFAICGTCHSAAAGAPNKIGPNLFGVVGRKAGTYAGFNYSAAMKNSGITWTEDKLAAYIDAPQKVVPGNKMPYGGTGNPAKAADIAAYLATLK